MVAHVVASFALAAAQGPALPKVGPASYELAHARLGMTPDESRRALTQAGYRMEPPLKLKGFGGEVAARIAEIRHQSRALPYDAIAGMSAKGPSQEQVNLEFAQWPDGPHAVRISFTGNSQIQAQEAFKALVEGRFGKPTMRALGSWRWCTDGESQCGPAANPTLPHLDADYQSRTLTLQVGTAATQAREALVEAEARKAAPLQTGSAF